jgi:hypothetical protein
VHDGQCVKSTRIRYLHPQDCSQGWDAIFASVTCAKSLVGGKTAIRRPSGDLGTSVEKREGNWVLYGMIAIDGNTMRVHCPCDLNSGSSAHRHPFPSPRSPPLGEQSCLTPTKTFSRMSHQPNRTRAVIADNRMVQSNSPRSVPGTSSDWQKAYWKYAPFPPTLTSPRQTLNMCHRSPA